jgi:hypothetical protein
MKVAIMQPYLFPYIGYFQLMNAVDQFVILDDVQYIRRGWINRNKILVNNSEFMFTFSLAKDSSRLNINQRFFSEDYLKEKEDILETIKRSYGKLENYRRISNLIEEILNVDTRNEDISRMIARSLRLICNYLEISTPIIFSSELGHHDGLKGEDKIIDINKQLNSNHYINPIGGMELYSEENFLKQGIQLSFLRPREIQYKQREEFIPGLSIIDVLMFNTREEVIALLKEYDFVNQDERRAIF